MFSCKLNGHFGRRVSIVHFSFDLGVEVPVPNYGKIIGMKHRDVSR